jgi:hypothetical protein
MADIGEHVLPPLNNALRDFKSVLEGLRSIIPGANGDGDSKWKVGTRALEGAGLGAVGGAAIGAFGGPVGAVGGAILGGAAGGLYGLTEGLFKSYSKTVPMVDDFGRELGATTGSVKGFGDALRGLGGGASGSWDDSAKKMNFLEGPKSTLKAQPISLSLNIDGRVLAQTTTEQLEYLTEHATGAPSYNGQSHFARADSGAALV